MSAKWIVTKYFVLNSEHGQTERTITTTADQFILAFYFEKSPEGVVFEQLRQPFDPLFCEIVLRNHNSIIDGITMIERIALEENRSNGYNQDLVHPRKVVPPQVRRGRC